jgi:hypothetical protein
MILASRALPRVTRAGGSPLAPYPVPVSVQAVGVCGEDLEALVGDVGFSEARETLEKMLQERYAPRTQTLTCILPPEGGPTALTLGPPRPRF